MKPSFVCSIVALFRFDLQVRSYLGDAEASKWVTKHLPGFAGGRVSTPPIVFATPEGGIVGRIDNYAPVETVLSKTHEVLKANPEFNQLADTEKKLAGIEKAQLLIDLQRYDEAATVLSGNTSDTARFLSRHLARLDNDWDAAERYFAKITDKEWLDDVRMEKAYRHWVANDYSSLEKALADFLKDSNRFSEARYFAGLAYYHQGKVGEAQATWKNLIKASKEDRWIYRADWAHSQAGQKGQRRSFGGFGRGSTPLGRIGYMGAEHPDLQVRE